MNNFGLETRHALSLLLHEFKITNRQGMPCLYDYTITRLQIINPPQ
jgi:hypothetical protein